MKMCHAVSSCSISCYDSTISDLTDRKLTRLQDLPEEQPNFLSWNFRAISGGTRRENANRLRKARSVKPFHVLLNTNSASGLYF